MLWFTADANQTSDAVTRFDDIVVSTHQMVATVNGNVLIEEFVPGLNDWLVRATITTVTVVTIPANKTEPTKWRARCTSHTTGTWGVAIR